MNSKIRDQYARNITNYQAEHDQNQRRYNVVAYLRLVVFLVGCVITYFLFPVNTYFAIGVGVAFLILFLNLIKYHIQLSDMQLYRRRLVTINEAELRALEGDFSGFESGKEFIDPAHPYSYDLDLFGDRSVFQFLNRTVTLLGKKQLASWLTSPFRSEDAIAAQQAALKELAQELDWTQRFQGLGYEKLESDEDLRLLQEWLDHPTYYINKRIWKILLIALPALWLLSIGVSSLQLLGPDLTWHLPTFLFLVHLGIVGRHVNRTNRTQAQVGKKSRILEKFADLFEHIEGKTFQAGRLISLKQRLNSDSGQTASEAIASLGKISRNLDQRLNMVAGIMLNGVLLWDIQVSKRLEEWKAIHKSHLRDWFSTIAEWDALISLSRLSANHPGYCWPKPVGGAGLFQGKDLGHPFISLEERVDNDLELLTPGTFWLVTGANMAGKSTYLRAVGVNLILAMVGAPVCARSLTFSPMQLVTSMRNTDSLQDHTSYFYAELKRLKYIIDLLKQEGKAFIMVDEMLRGTNSKDKQTGSRRFIEQLVQLKGMGLIATHDLALGELQEVYPGSVYNKRFEVDIRDRQLYFDYKLLDGLSQNLNATFLMEEMGIM